MPWRLPLEVAAAAAVVVVVVVAAAAAAVVVLQILTLMALALAMVQPQQPLLPAGSSPRDWSEPSHARVDALRQCGGKWLRRLRVGCSTCWYPPW
jgi:hypothetical protein